MAGPQIIFDVDRFTDTSRSVIRNAAHAMGLVWPYYVGDAEIRVHLVFQDHLYHSKTYHPLPWHGLCTPEERRIRLAVAAHEGAMGPLRLDQASIVTTAHEMMHLVQHHRGDPLVALLSDDGSISSDYYAHPHEREAWDAGLHALKP